MHITPILLKNYSFHNFLKRSKDIVRGNYLWGNFPGGIIQEQLSGGGGALFLGGNFPRGIFNIEIIRTIFNIEIINYWWL